MAWNSSFTKLPFLSTDIYSFKSWNPASLFSWFSPSPSMFLIIKIGILKNYMNQLGIRDIGIRAWRTVWQGTVFKNFYSLFHNEKWILFHLPNFSKEIRINSGGKISSAQASSVLTADSVTEPQPIAIVFNIPTVPNNINSFLIL